MKTITFFLLLFPVFLCSSCEKEDLTDTIDITQFSWNMKSITAEGNKIKIKEDDYFNNEAYILVFENDSIFRLNTSVNLAKGRYLISSKGNINIFNYQENTEVGGQNEADNKLLQNITLIITYQILNDILIMKGNNCEIEFNQE